MYTIKVLNWDKYNERADRGNFVWFRFQNSFFFDQSVFGLSESAQLTFVFLLCEASKCSGGEFALRQDYLVLLRKKSADKIDKDIAELANSNLIAWNPRELPGNDRHCLESAATDRQTDRQTEHDFDFETLYKKYPRKEGKTLGMKICGNQILSQADFDRLSKAVDKYAAMCRKDKTEKKYTLQFGTFMGRWTDYADEGLPQPELDAFKADQTHVEEFRRKRDEMINAAKNI